MASSNSHGNDNRGVRRFLRENGVAPTAANVERIGRELRRTPAQNEALVKRHKEMERERGLPSTTLPDGRDAKKVYRERVQRSIAARPVPKKRHL